VSRMWMTKADHVSPLNFKTAGYYATTRTQLFVIWRGAVMTLPVGEAARSFISSRRIPLKRRLLQRLIQQLLQRVIQPLLQRVIQQLLQRLIQQLLQRLVPLLHPPHPLPPRFARRS